LTNGGDQMWQQIDGFFNWQDTCHKSWNWRLLNISFRKIQKQQIEHFKNKDVEIVSIHKNIIQTIVGLILIIDMVYVNKVNKNWSSNPNISNLVVWNDTNSVDKRFIIVIKTKTTFVWKQSNKSILLQGWIVESN
jgi:hypothetical protein